MIDEQKLLDWLTREKNGPRPLPVRNAYRQLLSKIENGEFAPEKKFPGLSQFQNQEQHQASITPEQQKFMYNRTRPGDAVWVDDDDIW